VKYTPEFSGHVNVLWQLIKADVVRNAARPLATSVPEDPEEKE
jgi:hypothetical protein